MDIVRGFRNRRIVTWIDVMRVLWTVEGQKVGEVRCFGVQHMGMLSVSSRFNKLKCIQNSNRLFLIRTHSCICNFVEYQET